MFGMGILEIVILVVLIIGFLYIVHRLIKQGGLGFNKDS